MTGDVKKMRRFGLSFFFFFFFFCASCNFSNSITDSLSEYGIVRSIVFISQHYVSYLNNLRLREFCGAMDSLFMCFVRHNNQSSALNLKKVQDRESIRTQR